MPRPELLTPPVMQAEITQLLSYPIKSCGALSHEQAEVTSLGLSADRQWMLVDSNGLFMSQRKHPSMALIQPQLNGGTLLLNAPGMSAIEVPNDSSEATKVQVWNDHLLASLSDAEVNQWLSQYLQNDVRLVRFGQYSQRLIDPDYAQAAEQVAFADGYPILVTHEASLHTLNQQLSTAVNMSRFRPNVVLRTEAAAWAENNWLQLSQADLTLDLVKPCGRCVMTGVEQSSGVQTGSEVLKTLKSQFAHQGKAVFGMNAIPRIKQQKVSLQVGQSLQINQ